MKLALLIIDPQKDFCDPNGALFVPGAPEDMKRLARMVERLGPKIDDIIITHDSHSVLDISHPGWWKDRNGNMPSPFTLITAADVQTGTYSTRIRATATRSLKYLQDLEARQRYVHIIWPEHCIVGDEGWSTDPTLQAQLKEWQRKEFATLTDITKGSNPYTEHFSAVQAEVPDPADPSSGVNTEFMNQLAEADIIAVGGEASTHCKMFTCRDIIDNFPDPTYIRKMAWLLDGSSGVPDPPGAPGLFSGTLAKFLKEFESKGGTITTTTDLLK